MFAIEYQDNDEAWRHQARCSGAEAPGLGLFFSEQLDDIARAKAFCQDCPVKEPCFDGALARREPWGVWGGELFANGKVLANKRKRGRPPKVRPEMEPAEAQPRSA
jgi:WhiB family redox-sensing transcriptional regulator